MSEDRFEARCGVHGQRPWWRDRHCICPELRAAESSALERAARIADRYKSGAAILIADSIRALIPPAAAPAAECQFCKPVSSYFCPGHPAPAAETGKARTTEININDSAWVKVTPVGEQVYRQHWTALKMDPPPLRKDADGWTEFQLWELANVFGAAMYNGCSVPVETTIRIATPALAQGAETRDMFAARLATHLVHTRARISELETALREARDQLCAEHCEWTGSGEHDDQCVKLSKALAARAAPPEGEGK